MAAWAFIVGINDYPTDSGMEKLHGAVADAGEFAEWALHPDGGNVQANDLYFWTCPSPTTAHLQRLHQFMLTPKKWPMVAPDFGRPPTASEINMAIGLVATAALAAGASRLYVFLAGHGLQTRPESYLEDPQTCFVGGNYHPTTRTAGLVPCDDMMRMLKAQGPPELVLFLDACRSDGSIKVSRPAGLWDRIADPGHHQRCGIARSAQPQAVAYEVPHDAPSRGAFSKLLVNGLREHRKGGRLTFRDLDDYVSGGIVDLVRPASQYPDFNEQPRPWQLVLASGPAIGAGSNLVVTFSQATFGVGIMLVGGPANIRMPLTGTLQPQSIPLVPGVYALETAAGQELKAFPHVGPGDTHVSI